MVSVTVTGKTICPYCGEEVEVTVEGDVDLEPPYSIYELD